MEKIWHFLGYFIDKLTPGHFEGLVMYVAGTITITWVHLHHKKEVVLGLKGSNGMWEAPEWIVYIATWIFPHMIMSSGFMNVKFPDWAWWLMTGLVAFGLTGRWGLEWLLAMKTKTTMTTKEEHTKETKIETP